MQSKGKNHHPEPGRETPGPGTYSPKAYKNPNTAPSYGIEAANKLIREQRT